MRGRNSTILGSVVSGLALVVALGSAAAVPVVASDGDNLVERSDTTFRLLPDEDVVRVASTINLTNKSKPTTSRGPCKNGRGICTTTTRFYFTSWSAFWAMNSAQAVTVGGPKVRSLPAVERGNGLVYAIKYPKLWNKKGAKQTATIAFDLPAGTVESSDAPTRIEDGYAFFCWWGMVGDTGNTKAVLPPGWEPMGQPDGVAVERASDNVVLRVKDKRDPASFSDCTEVVDQERLDKTYVAGADGKSLVVVEAWPDDEAWSAAMTDVVAEALPNLEAMLGTPLPYGELRVREVATQSRRYSDGDLWPTAGVLGMNEDADARGQLATRLARAWIDPEQVADRWLAEGLATWLATRSVAAMACPDPVDHPGPAAPDLDGWIEAASFDDIPLAEWQTATACGLVEAAAELIGQDAMTELVAELIYAPVPIDTSHWLAGVSRDLPEGLDAFVATLDAAGVDH